MNDANLVKANKKETKIKACGQLGILIKISTGISSSAVDWAVYLEL